MKTHNHDFSHSVLARAAQLALLALLAAPGLAAAQAAPSADAQGKTAPDGKSQAEPQATPQQLAAEAAHANNEGEVKSLICPTNFLEIGALNVPTSSTKFGEYNGMAKSGVYGVGNLSVSGGNGYCQQGGLLRWDVYGTDLGTTSRGAGFDVGEQGKWTLGLGVDQLRHYTTNGFQTPFQGALGGNTFLLPPGFGVVATGTGVGAGAQGLTPAQLAAYRSLNVYNQRKTSDLSAGYTISPDWAFKFDYKHIAMSGSKLISSGSDSMDTLTPASTGGLTFAGQDITMLLNPTKSSTDNVDVAFNWTGEKAYASFDYYGSLYHDDYRGLTWTNPFVSSGATTGTPPPNGYMLDSMSTPPSNLLHQLNFSGGYSFSKKTQLAGGLSVGLNTQNSSFDGSYTPSAVTGLPTDSLHGRVVTTHADARLTHQFTSALNLNAGLKFDQRDNNTSSNMYSFYTLGGAAVTPVNAPMSNRREQADVTLDYRLDKRQRLSLGYSVDHIDRWCNNDMANNAQGLGPASYYVVAACAQVPHSTDNSLNLGYRLAILDGLNFKAAYTYSDRTGTINPSFYNPMQSASAQGYENYGWLAFFQAPRREHKIKLRTSWDVTDSLNLSVNESYTRDDYYASALGVQNSNSNTLNLQADYTVSDDSSFGAYMSWQRIGRGMLSAADRSPSAPPVQLWANGQTERDVGLGLYAKQRLLRGKLRLSEDLSYDVGKSNYATQIYTVAPAVGNTGSVPITSKTLEFRVTGAYAFDKTSSVGFGYIYQRLLSNDYMYNAFQFGYNPVQMLPNYMSAPHYSVNVVYLVYRYTFPQ